MRRVTAFTLLLVTATLLGSCGGNDAATPANTTALTSTTPETTAPHASTTEAVPPSSDSDVLPTEPGASIVGPATGTIQGFAFLCRAGGDCAASTSVAIQPADGSSDRTLVTTDPSGRFSYAVSPGDWLVVGRFTLEMLCDRDPVTVTVAAGGTADAGTFNCTPP